MSLLVGQCIACRSFAQQQLLAMHVTLRQHHVYDFQSSASECPNGKAHQRTASFPLRLHCAVESLVLISEAVCKLSKAVNNRVYFSCCDLHHLLHGCCNGP